MIRNSNPRGNRVFLLTGGGTSCQEFTLIWCEEGLRTLLDLSEEETWESSPYTNAEDARSFLLVTSAGAEPPLLRALVVRYEEQGEDRVLVDVREADLDFVSYIQETWFPADAPDRTLRLQICPGPETAELLENLARAAREGRTLERDPELGEALLRAARSPDASGETVTLRIQQQLTPEDGDLLTDLGRACETGTGFRRDLRSAVTLYALSGLADSGDGVNNLGWMYEHGLGVPRDLSRSETLYQQAAELGSTEAMVNLGSLYESGALGTPDLRRSTDWYARAARAGNPGGMFQYARCLFRGQGVEQDYDQAYALFRQLAQDGVEDAACFYAGYCCQKGLGNVPVRYDLARTYYEMGAGKGEVNCSNQLGVVYGEGLGVPRDPHRAMEYYTRAAQGGNPLSWVSMGWLYESGALGTPDLPQARACFCQAALLGDETGAAEYRRMAESQAQ